MHLYPLSLQPVNTTAYVPRSTRYGTKHAVLWLALQLTSWGESTPLPGVPTAPKAGPQEH
jgi:hypothetical protein